MKRVAAILAAIAMVSFTACGDDDGTQAPSTGERSSAPVADTDSPFPGRNDSFDPNDPNSLCFGASPDIPNPYEGCPGYSPEQESLVKNFPVPPSPTPTETAPPTTAEGVPPQ